MKNRKDSLRRLEKCAVNHARCCACASGVEANCDNAQLVSARTSGLSASLGRLTRKYVSLVCSSTEKILTSAPERNQESHRAEGTSATPTPRSAARTTANIVS